MFTFSGHRWKDVSGEINELNKNLINIKNHWKSLNKGNPVKNNVNLNSCIH